MHNHRSITRTTMFLIAFVCAAVTAALPDTTGASGSSAPVRRCLQ